MPFKDLREFLSLLEQKGDLLRTKKPVDVKFEISSYIRKTSDERGPALLFENVKNFDMPVVGGLFATRERAFLALETSPQDYVNKFQNALEHLVPPEIGFPRSLQGSDSHRQQRGPDAASDSDLLREGPGAVYHLGVVHQPRSEDRRKKYVDLPVAAQRT